jgi:hypothetical protein
MQVMEPIPAWVFPGDLPGTQDMMSCIKALGAVSSRALFGLPKACKGHALHDSFNRYLFYWILEISTKIPKAQNIDIFLQAFIQSECMQVLT